MHENREITSSWSYDPPSEELYVWTISYESVRRANQLLAYSDSHSGQKSSSDRKFLWIAAGLFLHPDDSMLLLAQAVADIAIYSPKSPQNLILSAFLDAVPLFK